jgi:hypothetical protein
MTAQSKAARRFFRGFTVALTFLLAAFCGIREMDARPVPPGAQPPYLAYQRFRFERGITIARPSYYTGSEWRKKSADDRRTFWRCDYPVFSGGHAATRINRTLKQYVYAVGTWQDVPPVRPGTFTSAADDLIKSYLEQRRTSGIQGPLRVEVNGSVLLDRPGLLTVKMTAHLDGGGAHSLDPIKMFVFDSRTGSQLKPADIFVPKFDSRLNHLIDRAFRKQHGLSANDPLDKQKGAFSGLSEKKLTYPYNFAVGVDGITFVYNEYEIAAYACGPTEILIPWAELRPILNEGFKARCPAAFARR